MSGIDYRQFAGVLVLAFALGSLHAYSVLLAPLERELSTSRSVTSFSYALAIAALTLAVLASARLLARTGPRCAAIVAGILGAAGLLLAGLGGSGIALVAGFGLLYGFANGIGYALFLERGTVAMPDRSGLAIGIATATYGLGAMAFAPLLDWAARSWSGWQALVLLGAVILSAGVLAALAFRGGKVQETGGRGGPDVVADSEIARLWLVYFLGATGGLMAIGHAAGILASIGTFAGMTALAPVVLAFGNILGSIGGGWQAETLSARTGLGGLCAASALFLLLLLPETTIAPGLIGVGLCYGAIIAFVPAVILRRYGRERSQFVFGRVFTAWGTAGLIAPWLAGALYDHTGSYQWALTVAAALSMLGALIATYLEPRAFARY